jgi:hypothetical protein
VDGKADCTEEYDQEEDKQNKTHTSSLPVRSTSETRRNVTPRGGATFDRILSTGTKEPNDAGVQTQWSRGPLPRCSAEGL